MCKTERLNNSQEENCSVSEKGKGNACIYAEASVDAASSVRPTDVYVYE